MTVREKANHRVLKKMQDGSLRPRYDRDAKT